MIRRPPRSTQSRSSAASDVYKRQLWKEFLFATFDPLGAGASGLNVNALDYLFLGLIALTIVVSIQAVGIILVVAMLTTPAATAQLLTARFGRLIAIAVSYTHLRAHETRHDI